MTLKFLELNGFVDKTFSPVYILFGQDAYLRSRALEKIKSSLHIQNEMMNVQSFENGSVTDAIAAANVMPFFSEQKLVVLYNFDSVKLQFKAAQSVWTALTLFAKNSDKSSCIVIFSDAEFGEADGIVKVDCGKLSDSDVRKWIVVKAKQSQKTISAATAQKIADCCLNDMARISVEVQKLCDFCGEEIDDASVELMVHKDTEYVVFSLTNAITARQTDKAADVLRSLYERGEKTPLIFGALYAMFRRMYYLRTSSFSTTELAKYLGVKESSFYHIKDYAFGYRPLQLRNALRLFEDAAEKLAAFYDDKATMNLLLMQLLAL